MTDVKDLYVTHRNFPRYARRVANLAKSRVIPAHELERLLVEACGCIEHQQKHIMKLHGQSELMSQMAKSAIQLEVLT